MQYKNLISTHPQEITRILRRLWSLEIFDGPAEDSTPIVKETIIALSETEIHRLIGKRELAQRPIPVCYVTWPPMDNLDSPIYRIDSTAGPTDEVINPSIALAVADEWDF